MTALCIMLTLVEGITCYPPVLDRPQVNAVLTEAGWPDHLIEEAAAVAHCESGWQSGAHTPNSWHFGLFQINWWHGVNPPSYPGWGDWLREVHGFTGDPLDAVVNAQAARLIYEHSGWLNWDYCRPDR